VKLVAFLFAHTNHLIIPDTFVTLFE